MAVKRDLAKTLPCPGRDRMESLIDDAAAGEAAGEHRLTG